MKKFSYEYCLVKYVHDPAAGEMLNIGVLLFSKEAKRIVSTFKMNTDRLSRTFINFDRDNYQSTAINLVCSVARLRSFKNIEAVCRSLVSDSGFSIQFGSVGAGITNDLEAEAEHIFHRMK